MILTEMLMGLMIRRFGCLLASANTASFFPVPGGYGDNF